MTSITSFNFNGADVRTIVLPNGEPGFVGKDVAERLGYADTSDAIKRHCKGSVIRLPLPTAGGVQQFRILAEPDVLRLIVSSTLPEAEAFERWVFEEVLPQIRKTGQYSAKPAPALPDFSSPAAAARAWADQFEARHQAEAALALAAPKVAFVERYVEADTGAKGFRQVAKLLKANEARFREFLVSEKILYRLGGEWVAHQHHADAGRFEVKTGEAHGHAFNRCLFTPKGVEWVAGEWAKYQIREAA